MQLAVGVRCPASGARADVVLAAPPGTPWREVAADVLGAVGADSEPAAVGSRPLPPDATLGEPPLVDGALVEVGPAAPFPPPAAVELRCTSGPDAGGHWALSTGQHVLGREPGPGSRIAVDDPDLSRTHLRLDVPPAPGAVLVTDLGSTNGTTVDGAPVHDPTGLPLGSELRAGASRFVLTPAGPAPAPVRPTGTGGLAVNRPPRVLPPRETARIHLPPPPAEAERPPFPVLMVLAPLVVGLGLWLVLRNAGFLLFTLLSPVIILANVVSDRRAGRRRSRRETARWRAARDTAERALAAAVRADQDRRRLAAPDPAETARTAAGPGLRLWERRRGDDDVLHLRVGLADRPAQVEADGDVPAGATTASDVPVVVPLRSAGVLGVAGPPERARALARWLVVQAAVWHSPRDLRVVVLTEPGAAPAWEWARWLPHTRADDRADCLALFGVGAAQSAARVAELAGLVDAHRGQPDRPRVLVVVDGARALRGVPGLTQLLTAGPAAGVHAVAVEADPRLLPEECAATAVLAADPPARLELRVRGHAPVCDVAAELVGTGYAERVARALAPLRDGTAEPAGGPLPRELRWTDVARLPLAGGPDDVAAVLNRWAAPGRSTEAALGRGVDGVVSVDLRRDGPHALVAGTTGAGKSELLQTLLASLAAGNRPDELHLVLVDYKGGAAFGPCAELPHVVGTVTDLDGSLVERALASLTAELAHREAVLAAAGVADADEHRRRVGRPGGPAAVLPRLAIVVDEFAALAAELPEFVDGLVGIAQRGRSLGVHLVLATQRPEGVVSADIRANTNLRLCLAVQRETESQDVIDAPDAARISRATPGRGYLRTGHGELTAFQAARVGGPRPPAETAPMVHIVPVEELGKPPATGPQEPDGTSDLELLVAACRDAAARLRLPPPRRPWLPPLPDAVGLDDLPSPDDPDAGRPGRVPPVAFALLDVPARQGRRPLALDLDRPGALLVAGQPRSGRTTALRTLAGALARTASPDDVHLYVLDLGGGLGALAGLPHTGAVVGRDCPDRVDRLLTRLAAEVVRRTRLLGAHGHAGLAEQRAAAPPGQRLPHLVLLVDGWESLLAAFGDVDAGRVVDLAFGLLRDGPAAGLHVVLTSDRGGLVGRLGSLVERRLLLRLADRGDYPAAGVPSRAVPRDLPPGRALCLPGPALLAQVALLGPDPAGPAQVAGLAGAAALGPPAAAGPRPWRVDPLPTLVRLADLPPGSIGLGGDDVAPVAVDLTAGGLLVGGPPRSGRSTALLTVGRGLLAAGQRVVAVAPRPSPLRELPGCLPSDGDAAALHRQLLGDGGALRPGVLLLDDAELLAESPLAPTLDRAVREGRHAGLAVVAAGTTAELVLGFRGFVPDLRRLRTGLLLQPQSAADGDLLAVRLPSPMLGQGVAGRGVLVAGGSVTAVQVALP